jgi:hypothetical protein
MSGGRLSNDPKPFYGPGICSADRPRERYFHCVTLTLVHDAHAEFVIEEIFTGLHASGYGRLGDGRRFAFHTHRNQLVVEVYRPHFSGPVRLAVR